MTAVNGFIVYPTYRIEEEKARIHLFGRLENGESFQVVIDEKPYFFVEKKHEKQAKKVLDATTIAYEVETTSLQTFHEEAALKVITTIPKTVPDLRRALEDEGIPCFEADIRFVYHNLMDWGIKGSLTIDGEYEKNDHVDRYYENPTITPSNWTPSLKTVAIDIETSGKHNELYAMSLFGDGVSRALIISDKPVKNAEHFSDEKSMLEAFVDAIKEADPDILTGWNVLDFDFAIIKKKMKEYKLPFELGRADWPSTLNLSSGFMRDSKADFPGRMVLDGIAILKNNMVKLPNYKLQTAAEHFLGEKKEIETTGLAKVREIERQFREDKEKLASYNLKDSQLVYDLLKKSKNIDLLITRSQLTGMQLDRVSASIASLDQVYLPELRKRGIVAPCVQHNIKERGGTGGFVMTSKPGLYDYVLVLDFKSLYPSLIRTFNIDPYGFLGVNKSAKSSKSVVVAENDATFRNDKAILPELIEYLWAERDKAAKEKDELARYAIKILMNSFYGVLASPQCRFFNMDISNAITQTGQHLLKQTAKEIEKQGYEVIYGDTDSVFVKSKAKTAQEADKIGEELRDTINNFYREFIPKHYHRDNQMELEFEKVYSKFWMPSVRGSTEGSKKRYAGFLLKKGKEVMDFTGLEFVRRDWTDIAKDVQLGLLERVFRGENYEAFLKKIVNDVKEGKVDKKLIYRKALTKPLSEYTKTTPPHVKAARKLKVLEGRLVEYYMTTDGPEPLANIKHGLDYDHYIEKQIKPLADTILETLGKSFDDVLKGSKQATLGGFA